MVALKLGPMPVNAAVNVSSMMVANFVVATKLGNCKLNTSQRDKHDGGQFCSGHQFWLAASNVLECPHERRGTNNTT